MSNKRHKYFNKVPPFKPDPEHYTRKQRSCKAKEAYDRKIGVAFYPSKDVLVAVSQAKTMWDGEELHINETSKT